MSRCAGAKKSAMNPAQGRLTPNQRLLGMDERGVTFRTTKGKAIALPSEQTLARFVQHVLHRASAH